MASLCVNIDHIATVRQARLESEPDPVAAAALAEKAGASGITAHLREDRRHIQDRDVARLRSSVRGRFNLEMAATTGMVRIARRLEPDEATQVPERRRELTPCVMGKASILGFRNACPHERVTERRPSTPLAFFTGAERESYPDLRRLFAALIGRMYEYRLRVRIACAMGHTGGER